MTAISQKQTICLQAESPAGPICLEKIFDRPAPVDFEVDLGCGKGRFLLARALAHEETCFLGIERRHLRVLKVERMALKAGLKNLRLLEAEAYYAVENILPDESVSVYYLFFPDPWPKRRHHRRRLFDANFLDAIQRTLRANGKIHIATDHLDYFAIIRQILAADRRFAETEPLVPTVDERTNFELTFLAQNKPIGRCSFLKISS
jgi:tRNA (guanine-N7-)-methyltransferase